VSGDRCDLLCLDLPKAEALRRSRLSPALAEHHARAAKALGEPTRLVLAAALAEADELCVCDLGWIVERSQKVVSHHVRAMRTAGILTSRRDGKMVMYALTERGRGLLSAVLADEAIA
jgi:ArsR family transcriptional regulator, lead/cadmium/zinc/bismuth-responsive transcriptional repressor